ncbi:STAS domain-containing protein [Saccharothrix sp. BKS2]|uniref:STAS domain-containing protein n=1 Tax=Saccharothrix sp. BKS2 TaxID=3064400 RepID=UPI0039EA6D80
MDRTLEIGAFAIAHAEHDGVLVTTVIGDVDHGSVEVIDTELSARLDRRPAALVVDLDGVEFFGSLGITALLRAHQRAARLGVGFAVAVSRRPALRTLQVTDLVEVLRVRRTLREAVDLVRAVA